MERLTRKIGGSVVFPTELLGVSLAPHNEYMHKLLTRLAAYEDTGLEPEEVVLKKLALMGKVLSEIKEFEGVPADRMIELAQAEKDGRLMVLPVKEGSTIYRVRLNFDGDHYEIIEKDFDLARFRPEDFGRIVFKTREEAELALKKREEEDNETD